MCVQTAEPPKDVDVEEGHLWTHFKNMEGRDRTT